MDRRLALIGLAAVVVASTAALAVDDTIPAKIGIVKPDKLTKFVSKNNAGFPLPAGPSQDPTIQGAQISFFDTLSAGGIFTHALDKTGWQGLGNPAGSKGYKYKGKKASPIDDTCTIVLIKPTVIKATCKGADVTLTTPFAGDDGIILGIPNGTGGAALRYCAELGGTTKKNTTTGLKRKDAPAPAVCPVQTVPTATVTGTPAGTTAATATPTGIPTGTTAATATATNTPPPGATATNTSASGTPTNTSASATPTPTHTPGGACLITAGRYTETTTGGSLTVSSNAPAAFPAGGTTIQDVSAPDSNCVSTTVVPYPGGLTVPIFCSLPSFSFSSQVTQSGCGVGVIDSNGGSDLTTTELGDTSYGLNGCAATQACSGTGTINCGGSGTYVDSSGGIDITVGDGTTDTCASGGVGNAMVSIPVNTVTWGTTETGCDGGTNGGMPCTVPADCPGGTCGSACPSPNDGNSFVITQFPQTLDLTTDTSTTKFFDNDGDGCACQGLGPKGPFTSTGTCIDFGAMTVSVAGGGTVFSSAAPLHDLLFTTTQNSTISGPAASGGATCAMPPTIDFTGLAHRCVIAP